MTEWVLDMRIDASKSIIICGQGIEGVLEGDLEA